MQALFNILQYSIGSLFIGILLTVLGMAIMVFLIRGWYKDALFSLWSYVVGAVLFFLLAFQNTLVVGAIAIIRSTDDYERYITYIVESYAKERTNDPTGTSRAFNELMESEALSEQSDELIKYTMVQYPLLGYYISGADLRGFSFSQLPAAMMDELRSMLRWYIVRRLLWELLFVAVGSFIVIRSLAHKTPTHRYSPQRNTERIGDRARRMPYRRRR